MRSPLLEGYKTGKPIDLITYNLLFMIPITQKQVDWLNTVIYKDKLFHINYWSLSHMLFGIVWGLLNKHWSDNIFNTKLLLIAHTIFELWEWYAIRSPVNIQEFVDTIMDTVFAYVGFKLITR